jgi:superfamily I DNA and/or RNA helicase
MDENKNNVKINELNIDVVIVDEVSKVPFIEILQPIMYGKTVILVGDHKQLPPIYSTPLNEGEESSYDPNIISMELDKKYKQMYESQYFADLFEKSPESMKSRLTIQYRMHPDIMDVDNVFYGNELKFGGNEADKQHYLEIKGASGRKIITENNHVLFVDVKGQEVRESGSTSFTNPEEAKVVSKLIEMINENCRLDRNGTKIMSSYRSREDTRLSLGVISPYADQARMISRISIRERKKQGLQNFTSFNQSPDERLMVKTVDDFQGDERDIIILSMVRNRSKFLTDYRRINVAISRARCLLIIVGNKIALEKMKVMLDNKEVPVYRNLIRAIEQKNGVLSERDIMGGA